MVTSNWDKFRLLLWKNWTLQWNHKFQFAVELLTPLIFTALLVLIRMLVVPETEDTVHFNPVNITNLDVFKNNTSIINKPIMELAYSPYNVLLDEVVSNAAHSLNLNYTSHANASVLEIYLRNSNILAGVQFEDSLASAGAYPENFDFALRFPSELRITNRQFGDKWWTNRLFPFLASSGPRSPTSDEGAAPGYIREGFIPIQHAITNAFINLTSLSLGKERIQLPDVVMQRYPYPSYYEDPLLQGMQSMVSMIILLSFIYPCTYTVKFITAEKEKQLKEVMKIMGLDNWLHWAAWFVKAFLMMGFSVILIVIMLKIRWSNDVAVLTNSNWSVLLFYLLVYTVSTICFCFMCSTFFSRANTAASVIGLLWFIAYLPYSFNDQSYDQLDLPTKLALSLISNTGMAFGFRLILQFEATGEGLQWSNLFQPVSVDDSLSVGLTLVMILIASVVYLLICLYIEQIFPGDFGVPKEWYFPFTRKFWFGEPEYNGIEDLTNGFDKERNGNAFETEPIGKRVGLQIKNLRKVFNNKVAVNGVSMNMYEDEITVLLGHNGAGKTTTISMLTGMFPPSSGTAVINGSDIRSNIEGARMSLGICPQHNILFDDLTVADHIKFFSRLKGMTGTAVDREIEKYTRILQLENKVNVASKKLSGGMKRKLSVGAALCGGTKVVLCDEPSSGMDPAARRQLWDLLQAEKIGRTILLTTHFMDEADVLGDRIAIMCDGDLMCYGTSFFLKKKFGSGYVLICVKKEDCKSEDITKLLQKYIPDLKIESEIGAELSYQLPDEFSTVFEEMLGDLETNSDNLNLNGYGVSITSLEEVFMKVGAEKNAKSNSVQNGDATAQNGKSPLDEDIESVNSDQAITTDMSRLLKGTNLYFNQWAAMFLKKFIYTKRNLLMLAIQNFMPILFVVMTIMISRTQALFWELNPLKILLTSYDKTTTILETTSNVSENSIEAKIAEQYKIGMAGYGESHEFREITASFTDYILKLAETILVRINARYVAAATISQGRITAWLNNQPLHTPPLTLNLVHNAIAKAYLGPSYSIKVTNSPLPLNPATQFENLIIGNNLGTQLATNLCFCMSFVSSLYVLFVVKERVSKAKLLQFVGGVKVWTFWLSQFLWDFTTFTFTSLILVATISCFQEEGYSTFSELGKTFLFFMIFGLGVLPLTYLLSFCFKDSANAFAKLSIINIFAGMALFIVITVMNFPIFETKDVADALQWIFMIYPHFSLAQGLNKLNQNIARRNICDNLCEIYGSFLPSCSGKDLCIFKEECCEKAFFGWENPGILPETVYMLATFVILFLVVIVIEYRFISELIFRIQRKSLKPAPLSEDGYFDEDVDNEKKRVQSMSPSEIQTQNLVLDRVTKYYGKYLAVNQVSVGVKHSECFGLLGVNGAGKTTTFKMMTGDERISKGSAYVRGNNLDTNMQEVYKEIGYCPQFDALLDDLTGRETLEIFCLLRGVPKHKISVITQELAKSFGFLRHLDKPTKAYSGGNKRKLSTSISLIGSPSVVYLDEPTTGMDPAARRQLWNVLCKVRDAGKSIVLTSHSMEECEALCTRLAIMVNGEFKCIGSTQHLKNKFSKGLVLKMKLRRENEASHNFTQRKSSSMDLVPIQFTHHMAQDIEKVKSFVEKEFPEAILQEEYQGILTFYIPLTSIRWSKIFGLMESNRDELNIEDYSISQTTLEQIFLEFAKYQREDPREIK